MLRQNNVDYEYLMDIVLDDGNLNEPLKNPKNAKTKKVDKARKTFIESLFRLLVM